MYHFKAYFEHKFHFVQELSFEDCYSYTISDIAAIQPVYETSYSCLLIDSKNTC